MAQAEERAVLMCGWMPRDPPAPSWAELVVRCGAGAGGAVCVGRPSLALSFQAGVRCLVSVVSGWLLLLLGPRLRPRMRLRLRLRLQLRLRLRLLLLLLLLRLRLRLRLLLPLCNVCQLQWASGEAP